ncbi:hypothetical protein H6G32_26140 [Cylindrospermum sp. FACHB-282]|nr:hypothetical protein [Cylindrospermum sp. FACHB-282]
MARRRADDARVALLREILMEDVPHTDGTWTPPPKDDPPPEPLKVTIRALGGPAVEVSADDLIDLAREAAVELTSDITAETFGRLLYAAKTRGSPLLGPLLRARAATPLYRFRTPDGRVCRPTPESITP